MYIFNYYIRKLLLLVGIFCSSFALAQKIPYDSRLIVGKLDNGLTYYVYPTGNPKGMAIYRLFVKSGSVAENENQRGLAHFLEHLAFNGTRHFPSNSIVSFLESYGAKFGHDINAHTSFCETVYKLQLPTASSSLADSALTIIADWASALTLDPSEVEKERGVILSERLARATEEQKMSTALVDEILNNSVYSRRMTIGDSAVIATASPALIADYYRRWYQPQMMAVAVVGDIDPNDIVKTINIKLGKLPKGTSKVKPIPRIPQYKEDKARIRTWEKCKENTIDIIQLVKTPSPISTEKSYKDYIIRKLINRMSESRFNSLSFSDPAYDSGKMEYSELLGATGVNISSAKLIKGKMAEGLRQFMSHRKQIQDYGFTSNEINKARTSILSNLKNRASANRQRASSEVIDEIYSDYYRNNRYTSTAKEFELAQKYLSKIDSVDVIKSIRKLSGKAHTHYLLRGDNEVLNEISDSLKLLQLLNSEKDKTVDRYYQQIVVPESLCYVAAHKHIVSEKYITQLDATDIMLDNGARIIYKRTSNDKGRIYIGGFRKGGLYSVDSTDYHTALVSPNVIALSGVGQMSREAYSMYMAGKQASTRFLVDKMRCGVSGSASMIDAETMLQQLYVKWTEPRLDTSVARLTIEKMVESWRKKSPTRKDKFAHDMGWMLNGHNYANRELTDTVILDEVRISRMLQMYNRLFGSAKGFTFIVMADSPLDSIRPLIEQYIGALPTGDTDLKWRITERQICRRDTTLLSTVAGATRANVQLIWQQDSIDPCHSRNTMLSTAMKSVLRVALLKQLRENMGKVYSVSVSSSSSPYPSPLARTIVAFTCKSEDVGVLTEEAQRIIADLVSCPQHYSAVLEDVRKSMIKDYNLARQKTTYWLSGIRNTLFMGESDWTWLTDYDSHISKITIQDIAQYARNVISRGYKLQAVYEE